MYITKKTPVIDNGTDKLARWLAGRVPMHYRFQRRDAEVNQVLPAIGETWDLNVLVANPGGDQQAFAEARFNSTIYIKTNDGLIDGTYTVVGYTVNNNGTITVNVNGTTSAGGGGGYLISNDLTDWRLSVRLTAAGRQQVFNYTTTTGFIDVDVRGGLYDLLSDDNDYDYTGINAKDNNAFEQYTIEVREEYSGFTGSWVNLHENNPYITRASLNDGAQYDSNLFDYVPDVDQLGKFLTNFDRPTWFVGYPFDLSFIWPEALDTGDMFRILTESGNTDQDKLTPLPNAINRLRLQQNYSGSEIVVKLGIDNSSAKGQFAPDNYVLGSYVAGSTKDVADADVTLPITVDVEDRCFTNPIYLCWLNELGGWDYWLFEGGQAYAINSSNAKEYERAIFDLSESEGRAFTVNKQAAEVVKLGADNLTENQANGISGIFSSPRIYEMEQDGTRKVVTIDTGTESYKNTRGLRNRHKVEFNIVRQPKYR